MKKKITILGLVLFGFINYTFGQTSPVSVTDIKMKVKGLKTKSLYYGFAEGDEIIFNFKELKGKGIKEIEIIELPENSKFKVSEISDQKIKVHKKSVYEFRFVNSALSGRICEIKIERVPSNEELRSFNTDWKWKTLYDTTYVNYTQDSIIGYDTTYLPYSKKEITKIDTTFVQFFDKSERVHSSTAIGKSPYSYITVELPPNKNEKYLTSELISWTYYIGVGQEAQKAYAKSNKQIASALSGAASLIPGYGVLASFAVSGVSALVIPTVGDNVVYSFKSYTSGQERIIESGNGIAATGLNTQKTQGIFTIKLYNDNLRQGIDVNVKVLATIINKTWEDIEYKQEIIIPKKMKLDKIRRVVKARKIISQIAIASVTSQLKILNDVIALKSRLENLEKLHYYFENENEIIKLFGW